MLTSVPITYAMNDVRLNVGSAIWMPMNSHQTKRTSRFGPRS